MDKQKLEFELKGNISDFTKNINAAKGDLKKLSAAVKESLSALPGGNNISKEIKAARTEAEKLITKLKQLQASGKTNLSQATPKQRASISGAELGYKGALGSAKPSSISAADTAALNEQAAAQKKLERVQRAAAKETLSAQNHAITLRYALYDVSSVANNAARAMINYATSVVQAQVAQQEAFAQIEKTQVGTATTEEQLNTLKDQLVGLAAEVPVSFTELAKIGTLGAQLGIEAENIASFTETTAKFSAITGMSAEESAMGFGKIANLLGLAGTQYEALGSAIAKVGVTSAATEQQIISTAGQIGAVAKAAGFSASEVIGLSSAMASLKIAPEEARGVLVQTFNQMDGAARSFSAGIGRGSESLKFFAEIAGMTQEDFAKQWGDKASGSAGKVWENFIRGLGRTDTSAALNRLNLDGVRTSKGLTALGKNAEAVFRQIRDAAKAGTNGTFLDDASAPIFETLSAKFKMLQNSFENLNAAAAGNGAFVSTIGAIVDAIKNFNVGLTSMLNKNDFLSGVTAITLGLTAFLGVLLTIGATAAAGVAGMLAIKTAFINFEIVSGKATTGVVGFIRSMLGIPAATVPASAALKGLAAAEVTAGEGAVVASRGVTALKWSVRGLLASTGLGLLLVLIGAVAEGMMATQEPTESAADSLDKLYNKANKTAEEMSQLKQALIDLVEESASTVSGAAAIEQSLYNLGQSLQAGKNDFSIYSENGRKNLQNLDAVMTTLAASANGNTQVLADSLLGLRNAMIAAGIDSADALYQIDMAILATGKTAKAGKFNLSSLFEGLKNIGGGATQAKTALEKLDEILKKVFRKSDTRLGVQDALEKLGQSLSKSRKIIGYSSAASRDSLKSVKDAISALKESSEGNLNVFSGNLASLRVAMTRMGITSKTAFALVDSAMKATKVKGKSNAKEVAAIFSAITKSYAAEQKQNMQTISEYVSDLSGVLSDAFSNRYGKQEARDSITSAFISIKEAAASAAEAVADATNELSALEADKGVLEYQLGIAKKYGDTLRANVIQSKLDKLNADIAKQEAKKAEAIAETNKSLTDNTAAGIRNRATMRDLVKSGNDYLLALAQNGASTATLKIEAGKLADEFKQQGLEMGFAEGELKTYTDALKTDFTTVVDGLPKKISIDADADPALTAVKEFVKDANTELAKLKTVDLSSYIRTGTPQASGSSGSGSAGSGSSSSSSSNGSATNSGTTSGYGSSGVGAWSTSYAKAKAATADQIKNYFANKKELEQVSARDTALNKWWYPDDYKWAHQRVIGLKSAIKQFETMFGSDYRDIGYATGGFVSGPGSSTSDSIPAKLSNGEFVVQANAVKYYGTDFMNALNRMQYQQPVASAPASSAASGSAVVYLSPEDRQLLRAAADRPITLYADNQKIAQSANAGNQVLAQRGLR